MLSSSPASSRAPTWWTTELPIYFINTDESPRREAYVKEVFSNFSTSGLCRVRGVQGNDASDVQAHLEIPPNVTLWRYAQRFPRHNTAGTLALFASHVEAIAAAYDAGHAAALIVEDDSVPLLPQLWDFALDDLLQLVPQKYPLQIAQPEPFYKSDRGFSTRCVLGAGKATVKAEDGAAGTSLEGADRKTPEGAAPAPAAQPPPRDAGGDGSPPERHLAPARSRAAELPTESGHSVVRDAVNSLQFHPMLQTTFEALEPRTDRGRHLWENFRGLNWQEYTPQGGNPGAAQVPEAAEPGEAPEPEAAAVPEPVAGAGAPAAAAAQDWDIVRLAYGWEHDSLWLCNQRHGSVIGVGCSDAAAYGANSTASDPLLTNDCDGESGKEQNDLSRFRARFAQLLQANITAANVTKLHDRMLKAGQNANFEPQRLLNFMAEQYMAAAKDEMAKPGRAASQLEEARLQMPFNGVTVPSKEAFAVRVFQLQHCLPLGVVVGRKTTFGGGGVDRCLKRLNLRRCPFNEPPVLPPPEEEQPAAKTLGAPGAGDGGNGGGGGIFGGDERLRPTVPIRAYHPLLHTCSHGPQYGSVAYVVSRAGMAKVVARTRDATTGRVKCLEDSGGLPGDSRLVPCLSDWALFQILRRAYCVSPRLFSVHMFEGGTHVRDPTVMKKKQAKRVLAAAALEAALPPKAALSPEAALATSSLLEATRMLLPASAAAAALPWAPPATTPPASPATPRATSAAASRAGGSRFPPPPRAPDVELTPAQALGRPRAWLDSGAARRLAGGVKAEPLDKPNDHMRVHYQFVVDAVGDMLNDAWLEATLAAPVGPSYRHPMPHVFPFVYLYIAPLKNESSTIAASVIERVLMLGSRLQTGGMAAAPSLPPLALLAALCCSYLLRRAWRRARQATLPPAAAPAAGAAHGAVRTFPVNARRVLFALKQLVHKSGVAEAGRRLPPRPHAV